jgi:hypothetical protein
MCFKKVLYLCMYVFRTITYIKYIFHVRIQLSVTLKSGQDPNPDPHWFGSLDPDPDPH